MKRKALLKDGNQFVVLEESEFNAETALQEALKRNPSVIPTGDLELDEVVVVGREAALPAGSADLLLVDSEAHIIIVETKLSKNPELRRQVIAQLLDYGASLWKTAPALKDLEALALRYWHSPACEDQRLKEVGSLREGLEPLFKELAGGEWKYEDFEIALADNLANGRHVLLVVASGLMDGLSRDLLQYVNICLNVPLYGVEIDVFETQSRQLIVPRGVRYTPQKRSLQPRPPNIDWPTFRDACTPLAASFFEDMLSVAKTKEPALNIYWGTAGLSIRMTLQKPITVTYCRPPDEFQIYTSNWPLDNQGQSQFRLKLRDKAPFKFAGKYTNVLHVDEKTEKQARDALDFVWNEVDRMLKAPQQET
jgi:hypothetical protein